MTIEAMKARCGSVGPRALDNLPLSVRRIIEDDMKQLIRVAELSPKVLRLAEAEYGDDYDEAIPQLRDALAALGRRSIDDMLPTAMRPGGP